MKLKNSINLLSSEYGSSLVELAFTLPLLMLLLMGAVDFGRAFYMAVEVVGAAHAGAEYGAQNPTDTAGMKTAAQDDAPNVSSLSVPTPTYGCECSDGTQYSASCASQPTTCTNNVVYLVKVTASATYAPIVPWPGVPPSLTLTKTAEMRSGKS
jgi:Flp pilus assembly protein TadG